MRCAAGSAFSAFLVVTSPSAPSALTTFSAPATSVAPRRPIAGIRKNPAASAPIAAPVVLAAYGVPASTAVGANHPAATGNVAPIAAAGIPSSTAVIAKRTTANLACASPSAYAQRNTGTDAARIVGSASAVTATKISSAA